MAVKLTQEDIEKVKNYKYTTSDWTPLDKVFDPWWNWCVSKLPNWVSPNLITCSGIILPIASFMWMCYHDSTMSEVLPRSVLIFNGIGIFWYQTLDAIDGKQARKTDNCSPLGQILDHNLDQFSHQFFCI